MVHLPCHATHTIRISLKTDWGEPCKPLNTGNPAH
jgi:hypothetical protein